MPKLNLQISKPALLLNRIAQRYSRLSRILMEYVDNSLDDAERYYNRDSGIYSKSVKIQIGISHNPPAVVITDNCNGMDKKALTRLIQNVGESLKHSKFTNGQFGFGVHAFRAAAKTLSIFSKTGGGDTYVLHINRESMNFNPPSKSDFKIKTVGGTQILIQEFDDSYIQGLNVNDLMHEIQYHFDGLLRRKNLSVIVRSSKGKAQLCRPFSYRNIEGKRLRKTLQIDGESIYIALWVSNKPINNQSVYFTSCGRRINEVYEVKSFMKVSRARYGIWNHPHVAGYLEVGDIVDPVITRDEFRRTQKRVKLYKSLIQYVEPELTRLVEEVNQERRTLEMGRLGNILSKCFNQAVQKDNHRLEGQASYIEQIQKDPTTRVGKRKLPPEWTDEGALEGNPEGENGENMNPEQNQPEEENKPPVLGEQDQNKQKKPRENKLNKLKKVQGRFSMIFVKELLNAEQEIQRGVLIGDNMYVNISHPDFEERMVLGKSGSKLQITQRLNSYIANVSANAYKEAIIKRSTQGFRDYVEEPQVLFEELQDLGLSIERQLRKYLPAIQSEVGRT